MTTKRLFLSLFIILTSISVWAQPKDAWKATATLTAFDAQGSTIYTGTVFFIDAAGTIIAPYAPFTKAVRAEIADSKGKRHAVSRILGASENYGFVKLRTEAEGQPFLSPITDSTEVAQAGTKLFAVGYLRTKKETPQVVSVSEAVRYDAAMFYTISLGADPKYVGCPLINSTGKVVAIVGANSGEAFDVRFATALNITANSALDRELRALPMAKALPATKDEAQKYIALLDAIDTQASLAAMDDFIAAYPEDPSGYLTRAIRLSAMKQFTKADADFAAAFERANDQTTADAVHYAFSRSIYSAYVNDTTAALQGWNLGKALQEANAAYNTTNAPLYALQQANCLFAMERYSEAYTKYMEVNATDIASDETYFTAMLAIERAGGDTAQILSLLNKAIEVQKRPYNERAATYFFERAQRLVLYGQYRRAVQDYNEFEHIIGPRKLNDTFYYMREQAELQGHMYQQALDDIQSAILSASPERKPYYQTEEAFIYLACAEYESAKTSALAAYPALPQHIPLLRILAISHGETGDKAKAREYLQKAKDLGDTTTDELMKKYQ